MPEMAYTGRVGNRTNGLSSGLQLHHTSSPVGQTAGIGTSGGQGRRIAMDHAIADSHPGVTIGHDTDRRTACRKDHIPPWIHPKVGTPADSWSGCPILTHRDYLASTVSSITFRRYAGCH